ncbi:MAG: UDP-N-acetylmuramoyl-L-alanyl-D-glutamate--2,6-diaminopimelate ligase [Lentisphaeria bacterium]|nr:UDP-N-acetylmuramoyl-L-alanyl-D-glutamate--2,6-diaminopimelate ligase [Lentisphaeria bacterium]
MFLGELSKYLNLPCPDDCGSIELKGATADSRQVQPGWLFCAIKGAVTDGNRFVDSAIKAGAGAVLSDNSSLSCTVPVLRVQSDAGYKTIARVAEAFAGFPASKMRLVGITGTCGKTTTAFLTREILRNAGFNVGMIGTVVYDVGNHQELPADRTTPSPFLLQELFGKMLVNGVQVVVMECSSAALDQERTGSAKFSAAAFTNFSRDHLDYHGTMEAYLAAKKKLFSDFLEDDASVVLNADDSACASVAKEISSSNVTIRTFGANELHDSHALHTPLLSKGDISLPGLFNRYNATCAALLAKSLGADDDCISKTLRATHGAPGRLERFDCPNGVSAFVDYAHTPEEITCALEALRPDCPARIGILFGCGGDRDRGKRPMMAKAAAVADFVWLTSDNPRTEQPEAIIEDAKKGFPENCNYTVEIDRRTAILRALESCNSGDWLLIAGKGHEDYQEINHCKIPFTDQGVIREFLASASHDKT